MQDSPANASGILGGRETSVARSSVLDPNYLAQKMLEIGDAIFVALDADGNILLLNRRGYEVLGYAEGDLTGKNWIETCIPEQDRRRVAEVFRQIMADQCPLVECPENAIVTRSGDQRIIAWHNTVLRDENGRCIGALGSGEDITERKQAEESLRQSEERFRCVVETSPDAIAVMELDGRLLMVNRQAARLYGVETEADLLAQTKSCYEVIAPEDRERVAENIQKVIATDVIRTLEYCLFRQDGTRWPAEIRSSVLRDAEGNPKNLISVIRDITNRKKVEREMIKAKRAAEAANYAKSAFLANMSHEIRTPMTAILGFTDLLASPNLSREEHHEFLETIRRNGQSLMVLINDILDLSKIEAGKMAVEYASCSLRQIVDDIVDVTQVRTREKGLSLSVDYDSSLPDVIRTDRVKLRQILINLAGNAVKFTEHGGIRICVQRGEQSAGSMQVRFAVSDTGIGMKPEELDTLFQPFTQADVSTTRRFGGTGLGLAISKRLAHLLGGDIEVTSESGIGSTFTLTIHTEVVEDSSRQGHEQNASKQAVLGRVLLAEDSPDIQELLGRILHGMGLAVAIAQDGREACDKVVESQQKGNPFDLILLDVQMPKMTCIEAVRWLRDHDWRGPVIAMTAYALPEEQEDCLAAGCDDYLVKTAPVRELRTMVARHLPSKAAGGVVNHSQAAK